MYFVLMSPLLMVIIAVCIFFLLILATSLFNSVNLLKESAFLVSQLYTLVFLVLFDLSFHLYYFLSSAYFVF